MKRILVTGANKGIGLASVQAMLEQHREAAVILCARDPARGRAAVQSLLAINADFDSRLQSLQLDVTDPVSVTAASEQVAAGGPLYGLVNNAGVGLGSDDLAGVLAVNTYGVKRVCDAFLTLLEPGGRLVNVSSASGPKFVEQCSAERRAFFMDGTLEWSVIEDLMEAAIEAGNDAARLQELGLGNGGAYGLSKACVSLYTLVLAREHPELVINACTPGYIETDLTRPQAKLRGATPADLGMKPPREGTRAILHLLFGQPHGSGHYYGSDGLRSPLDRYRAPGSPEYTGEN